ncbi:hypothetical protein [Niveibacterium sp. COAC-50]|uniref:hypothetical protein n=1 Tax=Niveibacterium sp. COAC-50 TaxID=2729384 RepID=UPI00155512B1|nr:hypothetical protein [Niveibacterium sp. COAC-50]
MKLDSVLSLFAQKLLLGENHLPDKTASPLMLDIDKDIIWHGLHQNDAAWKELFDLCDRLASNEYAEFSTDGSVCIVEDQPDWKLGEWRERETIELPSAPVKKCNGADERCSSWRLELLAYYSPAHFNTETPHLYGIHFTPGGIASAAQSILKHCAGQPERIVRLAAAYTIFAHEMCHAWIEDICTINDLLSGNSTAKLDDRPYYKTQRRYNSYLFVEEALCNTAALSLTKKFLEDHLTLNEEKPKNKDRPYDSNAILNGIKQWMKGQPRGYRDFIEIPTTPSRSEDFLRELQRLLVGIYGLGFKLESNARAVNWLNCDRELITAIQDYFCTSQGCDTAQVLEGIPNTALHSPWTSSPPIHLD